MKVKFGAAFSKEIIIMTKEIDCKSAVKNGYMEDYTAKLQSNPVSDAIMQCKNTAFRQAISKLSAFVDRKKEKPMKKIIIFLASLLFLLNYAHNGTALAVTFTDSGQSLGYQPINVEIEIGDIDNDGDYDLLLASQGSSGAIEVYINNGSGTFTTLNQQFPQAQPSSGGTFEDITFGVIFADVNNDGWLDIVTADAWDGINIYFNDRTGYFLVSQLGLGTEGIEVKGVDLGDIDNDGDLDMIFGGHQYDRDNEVWVNDGNGIFTDTGQRHYSDAIWHLAFGDIDNDNDLDYVFTSRYTGPTNVNECYFNDGKGNFTNSNQDFLPIGNSWGILLRDIDNDGDLDFVEPNSAYWNPTADPRIRIFLNNGSGIFSNSGQNLGSSDVKDIDLGDIDNDGDYDIVIANMTPENSLLINDGDGIFTQVGPDLLFPYGAHSCKLGDLDNDGDLDLVIGNHTDATYRAYFSDKVGMVANSIPLPPTSFQSEYSEGQVIITWNSGADSETEQNTLTYNLRVGTVGNLHSIVTGVIHYGPGNMGHAFKKILNNLPEGEYIWSVQTVDAGYSRSNWAIEQNLSINTPTSPSGLTVSVRSSSQIDLSWNDNSSIETGFKIERKTGATLTYSEIDTVGANITTYNDTGLSESTTYYYRVRAYNGTGNSAYSNEANTTTLAALSGGDSGGGGSGGGGCLISAISGN